MDFLVDERAAVWLLEVNAFPDFAQTGDGLVGLVGGLWEAVVGRVVRGFFGGGYGRGDCDGDEEGDGEVGLELVLDLDLRRGGE